MSIRLWILLLSLTLALPSAAWAKKHTHAAGGGDVKDSAVSDQDTKNPSATSTKEQSGAGRQAGNSGENLDDVLDGKIPAQRQPAKTEGNDRETSGTSGTMQSDAAGQLSDPGSNSSETSPNSTTETRQSTNNNAPPPESHLSTKILTGTIEKNGLNAGANSDAGSGSEMNPRMAPTSTLHGNASDSAANLGAEEDPDRADRDLMVEWDRWRNRFLRAVQMQIQAGVNHPDFDDDPRARFDPRTGMIMPRFPLGTEAWFSCEVTNDKRIRHLKIIRSSGTPAYDKAVLEGVRALEGTSILIYPAGSHRIIVSQEAGIRTSDHADYQYHHFGDVEHYREPQ